MLELTEDISLGSWASPACLPSLTEPVPGMNCVITVPDGDSLNVRQFPSDGHYINNYYYALYKPADNLYVLYI